jgi:hypothetical protein
MTTVKYHRTFKLALQMQPIFKWPLQTIKITAPSHINDQSRHRGKLFKAI